MASETDTVHRNLDCGIELGAVHMPDKHAVAMEFRILAGTADEPKDKLGLSRLLRETIDKQTSKRSGRDLLDAFDEIGASMRAWSGREATGYSFRCLPEYVDRAIELHAEFLREPTFPEDAVSTAVMLTQQEIAALEDDPPALADKHIERQAFGPVLGRNPLGERETVAGFTRSDAEEMWRQTYSTGRMMAIVAGPVAPDAIADSLERHFAGFGSADHTGRDPRPLNFEPARTHHQRQIEQQQIAIAFPSAAVTDNDYPVERVLLGILSGGMSARLFTEVREKQGLAYDVHACSENPRGLGMIFVLASCKPDRAETTFRTLLREIDRLSEDVTDEELDRAKTRLIARTETVADQTRARCNALAHDLFHRGKPLPIAERIELIRAVGRDDLARYLAGHPRDRLSIVTLGPADLPGA